MNSKTKNIIPFYENIIPDIIPYIIPYIIPGRKPMFIGFYNKVELWNYKLLLNCKYKEIKDIYI